jgi:hypothetical protein
MPDPLLVAVPLLVLAVVLLLGVLGLRVRAWSPGCDLPPIVGVHSTA